MTPTITQSLFITVFLAAGCSGGGSSKAPPAASAPATQAAAIPAAPEPVPEGQLPSTVTPVLYDLTLRVDPSAPRFSGVVRIAVILAAKTRTIWLHGRDLSVSRADVTSGHGAPLVATYTQVTPEGVARLALPQEVGPGEFILTLHFDAAYNTQLDGLYHVRAQDADYVFSQFEAIAARRAFPCFDEPRFKTPFEVTLKVPEGLQAISNNPQMSEQRAGDGEKALTFTRTDKLPTYLLAFAVGPLDIVDGPAVRANFWRKDPLPLRGVAVRGKGNGLAYALANTGALVTALEEYFHMPYPWAKLDIIAVPDFAAGAMENAGAITFRDWFLLIDPDTATSSQRRGFIEVVAHELVHQWFGDLVTMAWWDDLWLNESFATWLGYRTAAQFDPTAHIDLEARQGVLGAMGQDSLKTARQIRQPITSTHDIRSAFDAITYQKGGGVLAMFESYLTPERMQAGIIEHLHNFEYGTATASDFLHSLATGAKEDVTASFSSFLNQPGVPQVDLTWTCDAQGAAVTLTQRRYVPLGTELDTKGVWEVPVCVRYGDKKSKGGRACFMLTSATQEARLNACPAWLLPNADAAGYYRFGITAEALQKLARAPLSPGEQLAVADSAQAAFMAGTLPAAPVLTAITPFAQSTVRAVAVAPIDLLRFMHDEVLTDPERAKARPWMAALYKKNAARLGFGAAKNTSRGRGEDDLLRRQVLGFLADTTADAAVRARLSKMGVELIGFGGDGAFHAAAAPPDLTDLALSVAAETRGDKYVEALTALLHQTDAPGQRRQMLGALAAVQTPALADILRALTLDTRLRTNEVLMVLGGQLRRPALRAAAWEYFKTNYDGIVARLSVSDQAHVAQLTGRLCDAAALAEAEAFLTPKVATLQGGPRALAQGLEQGRQCVARVETQGPSVRAFFEHPPR